VRQGSNLGPILFNIYTCDLRFLDTDAVFYLFADDTCLINSNRILRNLILNTERDLQLVLTWCHNNDLSLNIEKTKFILSGTKTSIDSIKLHEVNCSRVGNCECDSILYTKNYKYLGIYIDQNLTFADHIGYLKCKLRHSLSVLYATARICSLQFMKILYDSFFQSQLNYALTIWGGAARSNMEGIAILQRKAIRLLGSKIRHPHNLHSAELFQELNILPVCKLYIYRSTLRLFKNPPIVDLSVNLTHTNRNTVRGILSIPYQRVSLFANSYSINSIRIYNHFSSDFETLKIGLFKSSVKSKLQLINEQEIIRILMGNYV
jgi:hypothetical protein